MNTSHQTEKANKPAELLDLVDANDKVIGEVIREEANTSPSNTHREVAVILVDSQNKILLQKRSHYKTVNPGMWSVTAGHVLKGEDTLEAAHTELQEELGFDTELVFITKAFHTYDWETHFMYYYVGIHTGQPIVLETAEVAETRFFSEADLDVFIAAGENVNTKHVRIFKEYWQGKFNTKVAVLGSDYETK